MNINTGWKFGEEQGIHWVWDYLPIKCLLFTINMINLLTNFSVKNLASIILTKSRGDIISNEWNETSVIVSWHNALRRIQHPSVLFLAKVKIRKGTLSKPKQSDILQSNWPVLFKNVQDMKDETVQMKVEEMTAKYKTPESILGLKRALLGQQAKCEWSLCMRWCYWIQLLLDRWLVTLWLFMTTS